MVGTASRVSRIPGASLDGRQAALQPFTASSHVDYAQITGDSPRAATLHPVLEAPPGDDIIRSKDLEIRPGELVALAGGKPLPLTGRELQLLTALARRAGRIVRREELYAAVWEQPFRESD